MAFLHTFSGQVNWLFNDIEKTDVVIGDAHISDHEFIKREARQGRSWYRDP